MLFDRDLSSINEQDLQALKDDKTPEGRQLDYKLDLPDDLPKNKVGFLKDIVAFANSAGGILLYGIDEERDADNKPTGIPKEIKGIENLNFDDAQRRLDLIIQNGTDPRVPGVNIGQIPLENGNTVLAVRVPKSWSAPHAVDYQGHWRFYARGNALNYPLDVAQTRDLFNASENLSIKIRDFRADRIAKILSGETPVPLEKKPCMVFQLIPFEAFNQGFSIDLKDEDAIFKLGRIGSSEGDRKRFNLDGFLMYDYSDDAASFYVQVFRNGIVEAVDTMAIEPASQSNKTLTINGADVATTMKGVLIDWLPTLKQLGVSPPIFGFLTFLEVRGCALDKQPTRKGAPILGRHRVDRAIVELPEISIQDFSSSPDDLLRDPLDALWQAAGEKQCNLYYPTGKIAGTD